jgi:tRNASer (uridine44-2'-O)-methyltransferase
MPSELQVERRQFDPAPCDGTISSLTSTSDVWSPIISCPADFPLELFQLAVSQLIYHPEYNSTLILRSDTLADLNSDFPSSLPTLAHLRPLRCIHRKLLPRRPGRDASLEQFCTFYGPTEAHDHTDPPSTLLLSPIVPPGSSLPYYHPTVSHLAFRHLPSDPPTLRIEAVLFPNTPTDPNSRLYRTCLALLDTLHRYGWGAMTK